MDERDMSEGCPLPAHRLAQETLTRRVGQMLFTTDDVGDAHVMVIHGHRQVVGGDTVAPEEDKILEVLIRESHPAPGQGPRSPFLRPPAPETEPHVAGPFLRRRGPGRAMASATHVLQPGAAAFAASPSSTVM